MASQTDDLALLLRAGDRFDELVHQVPVEAWQNDTPDTDWDVRDLVNHLVSEHLWAPHLLRGETVEEVGDRYEGDVVGADPVAVWERAWAESRRAWSSAADDQPVHLSSGTSSLQTYREQMLFDLVVHGWDLARAAGLDEAGDAEAVRRALQIAEESADDWAGSSMFGDPVDVQSDDPQDRLLGLTGRRP